MKKVFKCFIFVILSLILSAQNSHSQENFSRIRIAVKFKSEMTTQINIDKEKPSFFGISQIDLLNNKYNCSKIRRQFKFGKENTKIYEKLEMGNVFILEFEQEIDIRSAIGEYQETGVFEYVEPDYVGACSGRSRITPDDTFFSRQWSLYNDGTFPTEHPGTVDADVEMTEAWDIETGSSDVIAAILDSGCRLTHPELQNRIWINTLETAGNSIDDDGNGYIDDYQGWDFAYDDNDPTDAHGHGTNVTGIVGADGNNAIGYAGVDWNCRLMICQILSSSGWGYYSWWSDAIYYAVNNGAKTINMSVGGSSYSASMETAVDYAQANGVVINACMMNTNNNTPYYPAAYTNTIAVGATDTDDSRCNPFFWGGGSNYGNHLNVVAPGNYLYGLAYNSDTNYNYYYGGTSQATPHVTGLVSLLFARNSSFSYDEIKNIVQTTAEDQVGDVSEDTAGWDQYYGYGRINAFEALSYTVGEPPEITIELNGSAVELNWSSYPDAVSYNVYNSEDPYEDYENWTKVDSTVVDTFWTETVSEDGKFYYITAETE